MREILMRQDRPGIEGLKKLISHLPNNIVGLEVGCYAGESTEIFASSGKFTQLFCLDFWQDGFYSDRGTTGAEQIFDAMRAKYPVISKVKDNSENMLTLFKDVKIDFIYIDADHSYNSVKRDIENALKLLNGTGFIGGHDYVPEFPGVMQAVDELVKPSLFCADSSWLRKL